MSVRRVSGGHSSLLLSGPPWLPDQVINIRKQKSSVWDFRTPLPALLVNCQACTLRPLDLVCLENLSFPSRHFLQEHPSCEMPLWPRPPPAWWDSDVRLSLGLFVLLCVCSFRLSGEDFGFAFSSACNAVLCHALWPLLPLPLYLTLPQGRLWHTGWPIAMNLSLRRMRSYYSSVWPMHIIKSNERWPKLLFYSSARIALSQEWKGWEPSPLHLC